MGSAPWTPAGALPLGALDPTRKVLRGKTLAFAARRSQKIFKTYFMFPDSQNYFDALTQEPFDGLSSYLVHVYILR